MADREHFKYLEDHHGIHWLSDHTMALKGIPAKVAVTVLDPDATRATPRLARRALQMVCRLLAYNAELDLARRLKRLPH